MQPVRDRASPLFEIEVGTGSQACLRSKAAGLLARIHDRSLTAFLTAV